MSFLGKIKKSLTLFILTAIIGSFFVSMAQAGFTDSIGKLFSTQDQGLSFTKFEGELAELDKAGYDESLTSSSDLKEFILKIVNFALGFLGLLAVIIVIYGGVLYVTAAGEEEKTQKGKKAITYATIGLLIVLGSFAFVNTIIKGAIGDGSEERRYVVGANTGASFNAAATQVRSLAKEIYDGFVFLAEINEELKSIQSDAAKSSLAYLLTENTSGYSTGYTLIGNDIKVVRAVSRSNVVSFLFNEKQKLLTIRSRFNKFSSTYIAVNELIRLIDGDIDTIQSYAEVLVNYEYDLFEGETGLGTGNSGLEFKNGDLVDCGFYEDIVSACERYPKAMLKKWTAIQEELFDPSGNKPRSLQGIIQPIKEDYEKTVKEKLAEIVAIKQSLSGVEAAESGPVGQLFKNMMEYYGYDAATPNASNPADSFIAKIKNWTLNIVANEVDAIGAVLYSALETQLKLADEIAKLQAVEAHLRANVVAGNAPLVVTFDVLDSLDPAGGTLVGQNITWNLDGAKTFEGEDVSSFTENAVECNSPSTTEDQEVFGPAFRQCAFRYPGTYVATVTVKSNDSRKFVSGTSSLLIKVNPPTTKIELSMKIGNKNRVQIMGYYENGILKTDKDYIPVTLNEVKANDSITFNASDTKNAASFKWDFGNGEVVEGGADAFGEQSTQYKDKGKYRVELVVTNKLGEVDTKIFTVDVRDVAARITVSPSENIFIGNNVYLDAGASSASGGKIKAYEWEVHKISDGKEEAIELGADANKQAFNYKFKEPGKYRIDLKITSDLESVEAQPYTIKVESKPPVAMFDHKTPDKTQPGTVYFNGNDSFDPDGDKENLSYQWKITPESDNNSTWELVKDSTLQDINLVIKFKKKGEYDVTLKVSDTTTTGMGVKEEFGEITKTIVVENVLDIAWLDSQDVTVQLDKDGKADLGFAVASENGKDVEIQFGDGEQKAGKVGDTIKHTYTEAGKYEVTAKVYDENDNNNTIKLRVYVSDGKKPIAKAGLFVNNEEVYDLTKPVKVSKKDIINFDAGKSKNTDGSGRDLNYSWDFGDTKTSSKKNATHSYSELSPKDTGHYKVKLRVMDQENPDKFDEDEIMIDVINTPPKFATIQGIPQFQLTGGLTTPVNVAMKAYEVEDRDGTVTKYRWWYFNANNPDETLGIQITTQPTAALQIGTNGKEGEQVTYGFGLEITDNDNLTYSNQEDIDAGNYSTITVKNGPNKSPTAKLTVNSPSVFVGDPVTFTSASTDPDGQIKTYIWDVEGDGFHNNEPTSKSSITHTFTEKNKQGYKIRLKVIDDKGGEDVSDPAIVYVDSLAKPPKAAFKSETIKGSNGLKIKFTNNSSADESAGAKIIGYKWDFDTASLFDTADSDGDGSKDNDVDATVANPERLYRDIGSYKVKLTITDDQGNTAEVTNTIRVPLANAPTAAFSYEIVEGQVVFKNNSVADIANSAAIIKSIWDFDTETDIDGDGKKDNDQEAVVKDPTHSYTQSGQYKVKLTVTDSQGSSNSVDNTVNFSIPTGGTGTVTDTANGPLRAILKTTPAPAADGIVYLDGTTGTVTFDFSPSIGAIASYEIDKNIYFDSDGNGVKNDDINYPALIGGNWKTNFDKAWGKTVVKLTVTDLSGNQNSTTVEIKFK